MRVAPVAVLGLVLGAAGLALWIDSRSASPPAAASAGEYRGDGRFDGPLPTPPGKRPNLVLLLVDTLRADCLGPSAEAPGDTPYLRSLAARGARLARVTAPAPATLPSITSLLTGLLPDQHRVDHTPQPPALAAATTTFAEALSRTGGYQTAAIMELKLPDGPESLLQGFETVRAGGPLAFARAEVSSWNRTRDRGRPFFLLLHTYEAHDPYGARNHPWPEPAPTPEDAQRAPPLESLSDRDLVERFVLDRGVRLAWLQRSPQRVFRRVFDYYGRGWAAAPDVDLARRLERAYRDGVREVDAEVERTVAHLEAEGLLEDTLLVVTSDHGEAFGEHGVLLHGRSLHQELVHVPCVAVGPAPFDGGRTIETSIGLLDLLPTFLELAGLPPLSGIDGRSMLAAVAVNAPGRAVLSMEQLTTHKMGRAADVQMCAVRTATETYLLTYDLDAGTIVEQLYDRASDPGERTDLASEGRIGDAAVSEALAEAIERARDRTWRAVDASQEHVQHGYGAGVSTVDSPRPTPAKARKP